ncbi:P-loop NTPase family protein [Natronospora cellulosivora (SeqCode)]
MSNFQKLIEAKKQELKEKNSKKKNIDKSKYYNKEESIQKIYEILFKKAHIPKEYRDCSFSNFDLEFIPENKKRIDELKNICLNYHKYFRETNSHQSVVLYSDKNGCGKTHVAVSMGKLILWEYAKILYHKDPFKYRIRGVIDDSLKHLNAPVFFMSEKKYIWCRKRFTTDNERILKYVADCEKAFLNSEIIIYDDLFRSRDTDFFFDELEGIISQRYDEKKAFIFTTNINILTIDQIDPELNPFNERVKQGSYLLSRIKKMAKPYLYQFEDYKDYRNEGVY